MRTKRLLMMAAFIPFCATAEWADIPLENVVADSDLIVTATLTNVQRTASNSIVKCQGVLVPTEILRGTVPVPEQIRLLWAFSVPPKEDSVDHTCLVGKPLIWLLKRNADGTYDAHYIRRVQPFSKVEEIKKMIGSHNQAAHDTARKLADPGR